MGGEDRNDCAGDFVLDGENVFQLSIIALCPTVSTGRRVDKLRGDAYAVADATDATLEDVTYPKLTADLPYVR